MGVRIDLTAPHLFGNDAAEDEDEDVFDAYALDRPEVAWFTAPDRRICVARAYKGEGKSALLRIARTRLQTNESPLIISVRGKQVSPNIDSGDTDAWVREWKRLLLGHVASEIGTAIGMAWTDDAIALVEESERTGFKSRSIVSAVFDRLKSSKVPLQRERLAIADPTQLIKRWATRTDSIWIFVDDVDENFKNNGTSKAKVASFFMAAREIANAVPQIRLRLAVRPNTWTTLTHEFEALSKVEQYCVDLSWEQPNLQRLLANRIKGYLVRTNQLQQFQRDLGHEPNTADFIGAAFEPTATWGNKTREIHVPLVTLARRRPRWLVELVREGAEAAVASRRPRISLEHVKSCLESFGKKRIADTISEFSPQCAQVGELIAAFSKQAEEYATDELMRTIEKRILTSVTPKIVGVPGDPRPIDVAAFLFQIGFLSARRSLPNGEYQHLSFSDQPALLSARTNIDDGVRWEIHPVFRQALLLRDASGKPLHTPTNLRGR